MMSTLTRGRLTTAAVTGALALTALPLPAPAAEMDDAIYTFFQLDQNEYRLNDDGDQAYAWEAQGWIGTDYDKLFLKSEGEQPLDAPLEKAEVQVLYSRLISDFWDAQVGVRWASSDCSPEGTERIRKAAPGYYTINLKAGSAPAVHEDLCTTAYSLYLYAGAKARDDVVTAMVKALWEDEEKLAPLHPALRQWKRATAVDKHPTAPYHPAAIAFYKSVGAWNADDEGEHPIDGEQAVHGATLSAGSTPVSSPGGSWLASRSQRHQMNTANAPKTHHSSP